jgi:hypothetical protein
MVALLPVTMTGKYVNGVDDVPIVRLCGDTDRSIVSSAAPLESTTRMRPPRPIVGGRSNVIVSGVSTQTPPAPLAGVRPTTRIGLTAASAGRTASASATLASRPPDATAPATAPVARRNSSRVKRRGMASPPLVLLA